MKNKEIKKFLNQKYFAGFSSNIKSIKAKKGLNENIIKFISDKNNEDEWIRNFRLNAYKTFKEIKEPSWPIFDYKINYNDIYYFSSHAKNTKNKKPDKKILDIYERLGVPLKERNILQGIAVDAVLDSTSVATTYKDKLNSLGIIFCPISAAIKNYPKLVKKYLGSVVPVKDNFFVALNSSVFGDGTFVYIPKNTKCPIELASYFRLNTKKAGQFERTLIIADEGSSVSYLEGCTAPIRDENQLHAAVVELIAHKNAQIKYSTVQNWYAGNKKGKGGIYNFVTKRGIAYENAKINWVQLEAGSAITWKYPSTILKGDNSSSEFYSVAITNNHQIADTGTKMIHLGKNTKSKIISKGISAGFSSNGYRGLVKISQNAENAENYTKCDSLLIGDNCSAHTIPIIENNSSSANLKHEAYTSKIEEEKLFYVKSRGLNEDKSTSLIVNGFCREILSNLPLEFAIEAKKLIEISLEGSIG